MEDKRIDDEFYENDEEEFFVEKTEEDSSLKNEIIEETTKEESNEKQEETPVEENNEPDDSKKEQEDPNTPSNNTIEVEEEESKVEESAEVPNEEVQEEAEEDISNTELSKTAELRMMFGEAPSKPKPKKEKKPIIEKKETTPETTPEVVEEKQEEKKEEPKEEKTTEEVKLEPLHHEEKIIDKLPEVPKTPENVPKYTSFLSRMIKYGVYTGLSVLFLVIAIIAYKTVNNEKITYTEDAKVNYQVCLKENDYYKDQCIGEDKEYISSATETIRLDYNYSAVFQKPIKKDYKYYIKSTLLIKTDDDNQKELLKKVKAITKKQALNLNGNVLTIADTVDVPFQEYNSYAQKYKNDYSLVSNCYLDITLVLKEGKEEKELSSVSMPLTKITYNITKTEKEKEVTEYDVPSNMVLNIVFTILIAVGLILTGFNLYKLGKFLGKMRRSDSAYEKKLKQILNTYDRVIVSLEDKNRINPDQDVYTVKTFLELLDVRDTVDKPILYYKVNSIKAEFYVQDTNKTYKFTMKESDFEEKQ